MNNRILIALACAALGIGVRIIGFSQGWNISVSTQFYLLAILVSVFLGIRSIGILGEKSFGKLLKAGLQSGIITTVLVSAYTYVHYAFVDVTYFGNKIIDRMEALKEQGLTLEQLTLQEENARFIFSPSTHATFTLAGFLIATIIYGLLSTFLYKKVAAFSKF